PATARPGDTALARGRVLPRRRRVGRRRPARAGGHEAVRLAARLHHAPPLGSHDRPGPPADHALDRRPERAARDLGAGRDARAGRTASTVSSTSAARWRRRRGPPAVAGRRSRTRLETSPPTTPSPTRSAWWQRRRTRRRS